MIDKVDSTADKILDGIETRLSAAGVDMNVDFRELVEKETGTIHVNKPVGNLSVNQATYKRVTMNNKYQCDMIVSFFLIVSEFKEKKNRRAILKLINAIDRILFHADIGVTLQKRLEPVGFTNVTDADYRDAGAMLYQLDYTCSYTTMIETETDLGIITLIYNKLYLQEPSDDGVVDAESQVELDFIYGGLASSIALSELMLFGGVAGSDYDEPEIYGGRAASTFRS
ncbi:MAG: hypothetical protein GWN94_24880 [Phycisphaerae bacterium]|nr:hypothetical protein [Phycisphaerae bacterium]NIP56331.1 hypothetical protein [Phycisphaerae bacterium]NIS54289.1 hypothetical protein [Phycisphaerae bacterium]NIX29854.1 hypothetical protein [Phycisphaerae bacterium]